MFAGKTIAEKGSHEARVFNLVPATGSIPRAELQKLPEFAALGKDGSIGFSKAMQNDWIAIDAGAVVRKVCAYVPYCRLSAAHYVRRQPLSTLSRRGYKPFLLTRLIYLPLPTSRC